MAGVEFDDPLSSLRCVMWALGSVLVLSATVAWWHRPGNRNAGWIFWCLVMILFTLVHLLLVLKGHPKYRHLFGIIKPPTIVAANLCMLGLFTMRPWFVARWRFFAAVVQYVIFFNIAEASVACLFTDAPLNAIFGSILAAAVFVKCPVVQRSPTSFALLHMNHAILFAYVSWNLTFVVSSYNKGHIPEAVGHLMSPIVGALLCSYLSPSEGQSPTITAGRSQSTTSTSNCDSWNPCWDPVWLFRPQCLMLTLFFRFTCDLFDLDWIAFSPLSWHSQAVCNVLTLVSGCAAAVMLVTLRIKPYECCNNRDLTVCVPTPEKLKGS